LAQTGGIQSIVMSFIGFFLNYYTMFIRDEYLANYVYDLEIEELVGKEKYQREKNRKDQNRKSFINNKNKIFEKNHNQILGINIIL